MSQPLPHANPAQLADGPLAQAVGAGDEPALRELLRRHNQRLFRTARAILRDDAEAEDAVQEGYLKAIRAIDGFRGDAKLSTWLTRIVANEALARLRKRKRAEVLPLEGDIEPALAVEAPEAESPEVAAMRAQARRIVERRIDALPEAFRTVFVLRVVEEMTVEETAAALGVPDATVRTRLFRARSLLRESLARELDMAIEDAFGFAGERCARITEAVVAAWRELQHSGGASET
jgi:RNA polymerase sigma-70 factor (ECF subfamily)